MYSHKSKNYSFIIHSNSNKQIVIGLEEQPIENTHIQVMRF